MTPTEFRESINATLEGSKSSKSMILKNLFRVFPQDEIEALFRALITAKNAKSLPYLLLDVNRAERFFGNMKYAEIDNLIAVLKACKESKKANEIVDAENEIKVLQEKLEKLRSKSSKEADKK